MGDKIRQVSLRGEGGPANVNPDGTLDVNIISGGSGGGTITARSTFILLSGLNTSLNASAGRSTSFRTNCALYRKFTLGGGLSTNGIITDVLFKVRYATNASTSFAAPYLVNYWGDLRWDDISIGAGTFFAVDGPLDANFVDIFVTMTGGGTVTLSNMTLWFKD